MQLDLYRADAKEEHPLPALLELDPGGARLGEGEAVVALSALEAGVAWGFPILDPAEEPLESQIHPLDDVLQHLGMNALVLRQLGAYLGQIPLLFVEADSLPGLLVGPLYAPARPRYIDGGTASASCPSPAVAAGWGTGGT